MTTKRNRFYLIFNAGRMMAVVGVLAIMAAGAYAAADGCDDESNDSIAAELALCSVHAYNIGEISNPENASDKQLMKDVVALKTTIITQQMDKQYEYMEAMIRRFKTQLEKAILTTKLQAAGAASTDANSAGGQAGGGMYGGSTGGARTSSGRLVGLATAEDCRNTSASSSDAMQCLLRNITKIQTAVTSNDLGNARRQLDMDRTTLAIYNRLTICKDNEPDCKPDVRCQAAIGDRRTDLCAQAIKSGASRDTVTECIGRIRACIIANNEEIQRANNKSAK